MEKLCNRKIQRVMRMKAIKPLFPVLLLILWEAGCAPKKNPAKIVAVENRVIAVDNQDSVLWIVKEGERDIESFTESLKVSNISDNQDVMLVPHYTETAVSEVSAYNSFQKYLDFLYCINIRNGEIIWKYPMGGLYVLIHGSKIIPEHILKIMANKNGFLVFTSMRIIKLSDKGKPILSLSYEKVKLDTIQSLVGAIMRKVVKLDSTRFLLLGQHNFGMYDKNTGKCKFVEDTVNEDDLSSIYYDGKIYWIRETTNRTLVSYSKLFKYSVQGELLKFFEKDSFENAYEQRYFLTNNKMYLIVNADYFAVVDLITDSMKLLNDRGNVFDSIVLYGSNAKYSVLALNLLGHIEKSYREPGNKYSRYEYMEKINKSVRIINPNTAIYIKDSTVVVYNNLKDEIITVKGQFAGVCENYWAVRNGQNNIILYNGIKSWLNIH